jgi:hypothetical protein
VLEYTIDNVKVLTPASKNNAAATLTCQKEMTKRIKRDLPKKLKSINL